MKYTVTENAAKHLSKVNPGFEILIEKYGRLEIELSDDLFETLIQSLVYQQLSGKAAEKIYSRLAMAAGNIDPESILSLKMDTLREVGLSKRKAEYVRCASDFFLKENLENEKLDSLSDSEIVNLLVSIKGVGEWTAQMLMIFALGREDVFAPKDLGIRKGMKALFGLIEVPDEKEASGYRELFSPYGTAASLYLWKAND